MGLAASKNAPEDEITKPLRDIPPAEACNLEQKQPTQIKESKSDVIKSSPSVINELHRKSIGDIFHFNTELDIINNYKQIYEPSTKLVKPFPGPPAIDFKEKISARLRNAPSAVSIYYNASDTLIAEQEDEPMLTEGSTNTNMVTTSVGSTEPSTVVLNNNSLKPQMDNNDIDGDSDQYFLAESYNEEDFFQKLNELSLDDDTILNAASEQSISYKNKIDDIVDTYLNETSSEEN